MVTVRVNGIDKLNRLTRNLRGFGKNAGNIVEDLGLKIRNLAITEWAKSPHPFQTKPIAPRIKFNRRGKLTGSVIVQGAPALVERGTKPHVIKGNPYLAFTAKDGNLVVTRQVNHPGYNAKPFLQPAIDRAIKELPEKIRIKLLDKI